MSDHVVDQCPFQPSRAALADLVDRPHEALAEHRSEGWWTTVPELGTDCLALTYSTVRDLLADGKSLQGGLVAGLRQLLNMNPAIAEEYLAYVDSRPASFGDATGEEHRVLRRLFSRAFTPRTVQAAVPFMEDCAAGLADGMEAGADFVAGFATPFTGAVLCEITGIPPADRPMFTEWVDVIERGISPSRLLTMTTEESLELLEARHRLDAYTTDLVESRRAAPGDDLISRLVTDPDCPLADESVAAQLSALVFAGSDTTRNMLASLMMVLADQADDVWDRLAEDPELVGWTVEEGLRWQGTAPATRRIVARDFDYGGRSFQEGETVVTSLWAANRDPGVYERPDEFDPGRWRHDPQPHLAFGHGSHFCLGASLARVELTVALGVIARTITRPTVVEVELRPPVGITGPARLVLDFDRRQA